MRCSLFVSSKSCAQSVCDYLCLQLALTLSPPDDRLSISGQKTGSIIILDAFWSYHTHSTHSSTCVQRAMHAPDHVRRWWRLFAPAQFKQNIRIYLRSSNAPRSHFHHANQFLHKSFSTGMLSHNLLGVCGQQDTLYTACSQLLLHMIRLQIYIRGCWTLIMPFLHSCGTRWWCSTATASFCPCTNLMQHNVLHCKAAKQSVWLNEWDERKISP